MGCGGAEAAEAAELWAGKPMVGFPGRLLTPLSRSMHSPSCLVILSSECGTMELRNARIDQSSGPMECANMTCMGFGGGDGSASWVAGRKPRPADLPDTSTAVESASMQPNCPLLLAVLHTASAPRALASSTLVGAVHRWNSNMALAT